MRLTLHTSSNEVNTLALFELATDDSLKLLLRSIFRLALDYTSLNGFVLVQIFELEFVRMEYCMNDPNIVWEFQISPIAQCKAF